MRGVTTKNKHASGDLFECMKITNTVRHKTKLQLNLLSYYNFIVHISIGREENDEKNHNPHISFFTTTL
jgi:hypothetical protein